MDKRDFEADVRGRYRGITKTLIQKGLTITTMESCTSGQIASLITDTEGASAVMKGAFVTYSNEAKMLQGVPSETIERFGVYSQETALAMARACRKTYGADVAVGITGTFGNVDPNNADSVAGEVHFAVETESGALSFTRYLPEQPSRFMYKLYIANEVAEELEKMI